MDIFAIDNFKALVAVTATIIGGIWAFYIFAAERKHFPKMEVRFEAVCDQYDENMDIVYAKLTMENTGKVVVRPNKGQIKLQQISPPYNGEARNLNKYNYLDPSSEEVLWNQIGERNYAWKEGKMIIEPGEKEEIDVDFLIFNHLELVRLYGYIENPLNEGSGWDYNLTVKTTKCMGEPERVASKASSD